MCLTELYGLILDTFPYVCISVEECVTKLEGFHYVSTQNAKDERKIQWRSLVTIHIINKVTMLADKTHTP